MGTLNFFVWLPRTLENKNLKKFCPSFLSSYRFLLDATPIQFTTYTHLLDYIFSLIFTDIQCKAPTGEQTPPVLSSVVSCFSSNPSGYSDKEHEHKQ
jgi:hypothetical protein